MTLEQKLLMTREPLRLKTTKGKVEVHQNVPGFLRKNALVTLPVFRALKSSVNLVQLLPPEKCFLSPEEAYLTQEIQNLQKQHIQNLPPKIFTPAYWGGGRSCLVEDPESGRLFRLKGIAFNERGPELTYDSEGMPTRIEGGQFLQSAKYEITFAKRFNHLLAEEGIPPVMQYRGRYVYPHKIPQNNKMAATIFEVAGDTRVDELIHEIELQTDPISLEVEEAVKELYQNLGFVSGRLKKLMDRNGMTWGDSPQNTNAHLGNIVIYPADKKHFTIGLVDFDASCDKSEFSPCQLRAQQHSEKLGLTGNNLPRYVISQRIRSSYSENPDLIKQRKQFRRGFKEGYACPPRQKITHLIDREPYDTLISILKMEYVFGDLATQ